MILKVTTADMAHRIRNNGLISSEADLKLSLTSITTGSKLYIDLEGDNLCRFGTLSLITILVEPGDTVSVIDVQILGDQAFSISTPDGKTLKDILADEAITKYFWDVRNDADALWAYHRIDLKGVVDLQPLENASRVSSKLLLNGLQRAIKDYLVLSWKEKQQFDRIKDEVKKLMDKNVFGARPMLASTLEYCTNDVKYLPQLKDVYLKRISKTWLEKAMKESAKRVEEVKKEKYDPKNKDKALGP